ncbi:hypothetical protein MRB53_005229 [Persea americana]|uniref:Uncharacterized protein n=1 Tax=Persea americana TaxID=3435 RepID=A0ACC2MCE7_PERAE|nr:hypothetical protein MRB53_005229 [Persea americana]
MIIEGSLSFNGRGLDHPFHLETKFLFKNPSLPKESQLKLDNINEKEIGDPLLAQNTLPEMAPQSPSLKSSSPKHEAAVTLQKVYKSFRTRRQLADCAVLVQQHWWKLLDFALLKRNSVSFFDISKPETAVSRWSRARTRAAMVGRGLSKDNKAKKLALQHWLEAIDPRHRYGHNLHFYYVNWLQCESRQPFFYWLDVGEGKEVSLDECPRPKLQHQCIKYLGPKEREGYEVIVEDGKFLYKQNRELLDSSEGPEEKYIFVLSTSKHLYVGQKQRGTFQHSSFLAGGATSAAGRLVVEKGVLKAVWSHSGHYRPTQENFQEFISFLKENNVDLTDVKSDPTDEENSCLKKDETNIGFRHNSSELYLRLSSGSQHGTNLSNLDIHQPIDQLATATADNDQHLESKNSCSLERNSKIDGSTSVDLSKRPKNKSRETESHSAKCQLDGDELMEDSLSVEHDYLFKKLNLFGEEEEEDEQVPQQKILDRINSKKDMASYQLGKKLPFKWTTGAGPRIGCVRDYPTELQFRCLEEVHLSPRSHGGHSRGCLSPQSKVCLSPRSPGNHSGYSSPRNMACPSPRSPGTSLLKESSATATASTSATIINVR